MTHEDKIIAIAAALLPSILANTTGRSGLLDARRQVPSADQAQLASIAWERALLIATLCAKAESKA